MSEPDAPLLTGPVGERFRIGRVVARSFSIWGRGLPLILALALVVHAPRVVCVEVLARAWPYPKLDVRGDFADAEARMDRWLARAIPISITRAALWRLFRDLSIGLVIFAVYAGLKGRRPTFMESVRGGLRHFFPVLRVSLLLSLLGLALSFGALALIWGTSWSHGVAWLLALLPGGMPVLVAVGLSQFWVTVPAAMVEEPRRLLRRSWNLTRGHRLAVAAIVLLLYAIDWGAGRLLRLALATADLPWLARACIWWTQDLLLVSLTAVFAAVGYHALRLEKEGVDVSDLERVFA